MEEGREAEDSSCSYAVDILVAARMRSAGRHGVGLVVGCLLWDRGSPSLRSSLGSDDRAVADLT